jgi:hypothetical protein
LLEHAQADLRQLACGRPSSPSLRSGIFPGKRGGHPRSTFFVCTSYDFTTKQVIGVYSYREIKLENIKRTNR